MRTRFIECATVSTFAYLYVGEALPLPVIRSASALLHPVLGFEILLLAALVCLVALLAGLGSRGRACGCQMSATTVIAILNVVPTVAAILATRWSMLSDNCPVTPGEACHYPGVVLDVVGLNSARLARLDLGLCLLLAARGQLLLRATGGSLGLSEAVPLHRVAGWWCAAHSALHSIAYLLFYLLETGGLPGVWRYCFPAPLAGGQLNRLGLVNFFGLLACAALLALVVPAWPPMRRSSRAICGSAGNPSPCHPSSVAVHGKNRARGCVGTSRPTARPHDDRTHRLRGCSC